MGRKVVRCVRHLIRLNGVPTKIVQFDNELEPEEHGSGDDESSDDDQQPKDVGKDKVFFQYDRLVLMISGNPGEIDYYKHFLATVQQRTRLPVIGVSNSGHNRIPKHVSKPNVWNNDLFTLEGQIHQKATFIQEHLPSNTRLILVGHSIGCYMILELLDRYPSIQSMVDRSILIFPTIDSMIETEMGRKFNRLFTIGYYPIMTLAHLLDNLLSQRMKDKLVAYFMTSNNQINTGGGGGAGDGDGATAAAAGGGDNSTNQIPKIVIRSATNLIDPYAMQAVMFMTLCEFKQVKEPNWKSIESNQSRLSILYGTADHWCPVEYYEKMARKFSSTATTNGEQQTTSNKLDIRCCLGTIDHAFVVDPIGTEKIASLTVDIIERQCPKPEPVTNSSSSNS